MKNNTTGLPVPALSTNINWEIQQTLILTPIEYTRTNNNLWSILSNIITSCRRLLVSSGELILETGWEKRKESKVQREGCMPGSKCEIPQPRFESFMPCSKAEAVVWHIFKGSRSEEKTLEKRKVETQRGSVNMCINRKENNSLETHPVVNLYRTEDE